jgi:hypothetical protein
VVSPLPLLACALKIGCAHNLVFTNEEIMEASATNANSKQSIANWLKFDHVHDLIFFTYCLKMPLHYNTSNFQSTVANF